MEVASFDVENLSWVVHPSQPAWRTTSIPTRIVGIDIMMWIMEWRNSMSCAKLCKTQKWISLDLRWMFAYSSWSVEQRSMY